MSFVPLGFAGMKRASMKSIRPYKVKQHAPEFTGCVQETFCMKKRKKGDLRVASDDDPLDLK